MIPLLFFSLSLFLGTALFPVYASDQRTPADAITTCESLLDPMRDVLATLRQGAPLSEGQDLLWRTWNTQCRHASWQQALAEGLPPVPPQPDFGYRLPPSVPGWRDYVGAALRGLEQGLTAPLTVCTTHTTSRGALITTCGPR